MNQNNQYDAINFEHSASISIIVSHPYFSIFVNTFYEIPYKDKNLPVSS